VVLGWGGGTGHTQSARLVLRGERGGQILTRGCNFVPPRRAARISHEGPYICAREVMRSGKWEVGSEKLETESGK